MTNQLPVSHQLVMAQTALSIATHDLKYPLMAIQNSPDCPASISDIADTAITQLEMMTNSTDESAPCPTPARFMPYLRAIPRF